MLKKEDLAKIADFCKKEKYLFVSPFITSNSCIYLYGYRIYAKNLSNDGARLTGPDWVYKRRDVKKILSMLGTDNVRDECWNHDKSFLIEHHVSSIKDGNFGSVRDKQDIRRRYRNESQSRYFV